MGAAVCIQETGLCCLATWPRGVKGTCLDTQPVPCHEASLCVAWGSLKEGTSIQGVA